MRSKPPGTGQRVHVAQAMPLRVQRPWLVQMPPLLSTDSAGVGNSPGHVFFGLGFFDTILYNLVPYLGGIVEVF